MRKTNEDLYADLVEQAFLLTTTYEYGNSEARSNKLVETIWLLQAYDDGQDIVLAKLSYDADRDRCPDPISVLRRHLGSVLPKKFATSIHLGNGYYIHGERCDLPVVGWSATAYRL